MPPDGDVMWGSSDSSVMSPHIPCSVHPAPGRGHPNPRDSAFQLMPGPGLEPATSGSAAE